MFTRPATTDRPGISPRPRRSQRRNAKHTPRVLEALEERRLLATNARPDQLEVDWRAVSLAGLLAIEAHKKKAPPPAITALLIAGPNASGQTTISGKTYAKATVTLQVGAGAPGPTAKANAKGVFQFKFSVGFGSTTVHLSATAKGHKPASTTLSVNRPDKAPPTIELAGLTPGPVSRTEVTITGSVADVGTGVASLQASVDGGTAVAVGFDAAGNFAYTTSLPLDGSVDGAHTVVFAVEDRAGNTTDSAPERFVLDTRPPALNLIATPALLNAIPTLTGSTSDLLSGVTALNAQVDNGPATSVPFTASGQFSFSPGPLADGAHTIHLSATNGVGNVAGSVVNFTLDTHPPTISVTAPSAGATLSASPTISGTVADALSGVASLQAQIDGGSPFAVSFDGMGQFSFPAGSLANGTHTVALMAADRAGNVATSDLGFTIQTAQPQAPTITIQSPARGLPTNVDPVLAGNVVAAAGATVASLQAQVDSGAATTVTFAPATGGFQFTPALALDGTADGAHTVHFRATDSAGTVGTFDFSFTLDTRPPTITVTAPTQGATLAASPTVTGTVSDATSGVASLQAQVDSGAFASVTLGANGQFSFPAGTLADGSHTIHLTAIDHAGNSDTSAVSFTLDTQAPTLTVTAPAAGLITNTNPAVSGTVVAQAGATIASLTAQVDTGTASTVAVAATTGAFQFTPALLLDGTADGAHTVHLVATDSLGHVATADVAFTLDTRAPAIAVTAPAAGATLTASPTLTGSVTDATSGVATFQVQLDSGTPVAVVPDASGNFSVAAGLANDGSADGPHAFHLAATDRAGNVATAAVDFTLQAAQQAGPTITIVSPQAGLITNMNPAIQGTVVGVGAAAATLAGRGRQHDPDARRLQRDGRFLYLHAGARARRLGRRTAHRPLQGDRRRRGQLDARLRLHARDHPAVSAQLQPGGFRPRDRHRQPGDDRQPGHPGGTDQPEYQRHARGDQPGGRVDEHRHVPVRRRAAGAG